MIEDPMATALAGAAKGGGGNPRQLMDRSILANFVNASAKFTGSGDLKAKYAQQSADPASFPTATRKNVLLGKAGARYGIRVNTAPPALHEAGPTQANGRVISNRGGVGGSFWGGAAS